MTLKKEIEKFELFNFEDYYKEWTYLKSFFIPIKPFSTNKMYWFNKKRTDEYNEYHSELDSNMYFCKEIDINKKSKFELYVLFLVKKKSDTDLDNMLKPFIDYLQERLWFNDKNITIIHTRKIILEENEDTKDIDNWIEFVLNDLSLN